MLFKSQAFLPHPTDQNTFHSSPNSEGVWAQKEKETRVREHIASILPPRTTISALITCVIRFCLATPSNEVKGTEVDKAGERGQGYESSGCSGEWEGLWTQGPELSSETLLKDQQRTKVEWESRVQDPDAEQRVCKRSGQSHVWGSPEGGPRMMATGKGSLLLHVEWLLTHLGAGRELKGAMS